MTKNKLSIAPPDKKNLLQVIDDFCRTANIVLTAFQNDGHYVAAKKVLKK